PDELDEPRPAREVAAVETVELALPVLGEDARRMLDEIADRDLGPRDAERVEELMIVVVEATGPCDHEERRLEVGAARPGAPPAMRAGVATECGRLLEQGHREARAVQRPGRGSSGDAGPDDGDARAAGTRLERGAMMPGSVAHAGP